MTGVENRDATREIDVAIALDVPDFRIQGACGGNRR